MVVSSRERSACSCLNMEQISSMASWEGAAGGQVGLGGHWNGAPAGRRSAPGRFSKGSFMSRWDSFQPVAGEAPPEETSSSKK